MLDDLNEDTDKASEALQAVTKKTKELIEQSGTPMLRTQVVYWLSHSRQKPNSTCCC